MVLCSFHIDDYWLVMCVTLFEIHRPCMAIQESIYWPAPYCAGILHTKLIHFGGRFVPRVELFCTKQSLAIAKSEICDLVSGGIIINQTVGTHSNNGWNMLKPVASFIGSDQKFCWRYFQMLFHYCFSQQHEFSAVFVPLHPQDLAHGLRISVSHMHYILYCTKYNLWPKIVSLLWLLLAQSHSSSRSQSVQGYAKSIRMEVAPNYHLRIRQKKNKSMQTNLNIQPWEQLLPVTKEQMSISWFDWTTSSHCCRVLIVVFTLQ